MIRSLYSGVSGIKNHQTRMDVISSNLANVNNVGYKSNRVNFQDIFYQMQRYPSAPSGGTDGANSINPAQIGSGVAVAGIGTNMGQGALQYTGRTLDLAIQGNGFFQLKDDADNLYYTRTGTFILDANGYLVDSNGYFLTDESGEAIQVTGENGQVATINIAKDGTITAYDTEDKDMVASSPIALFYFANQEGLTKLGQNLYKETTAQGSTVSGQAQAIDNTGVASTINAGYLEMSNVNLIDEFTNMITTQRGYQANGRTITTSDQMLQELLDLKR